MPDELSPETAAVVAAAPDVIAAMSPQKQERVASFISAVAAEPDIQAALTADEVAKAYEVLDAEGQDRITMVLGRQAERMANAAPPA